MALTAHSQRERLVDEAWLSRLRRTDCLANGRDGNNVPALDSGLIDYLDHVSDLVISEHGAQGERYDFAMQ